MKTVLKDYRCYRPVGRVQVKVHGRTKRRSGPRLPILEGAIAFRGSHVKVKVLLDTGNDITIVKPEKVRELEKQLIR